MCFTQKFCDFLGEIATEDDTSAGHLRHEQHDVARGDGERIVGIV
jgi:hypothetical protein